MLCFVILVCNYPVGPHVAAAIWPCIYLFMFVTCKLHAAIKSIMANVKQSIDVKNVLEKIKTLKNVKNVDKIKNVQKR